MKASITYSKTTPESAANGDHSDHGFYKPGGWEFSMNDEENRADILANLNDYDLDFGEAIYHALQLGICEGEITNNSISVSTVDDEIDYSTSERTSYCLHLNGMTAGTTTRVKRFLENNGVIF